MEADETKNIPTGDSEIVGSPKELLLGGMSEIESLIYNVRGRQVMLDSDLAQLYGIETKYLKRAVKANIKRFPSDFMFELDPAEFNRLRCSFCTSNDKSQRGGTRYMPFVFTEQGVAMLSGVLKSDTAIEVNIRIMRAFIAMRSFLLTNAHLFNRIETLEHNYLLVNQHLSANDKKIDEVLTRLDSGAELPAQGIFFEDRIFDAYVMINRLIEGAKKRIVVVDNYADYTVLQQLDKRAPGVSALIYTSDKNDVIKSDLKRHNKQYPPIDLNFYNKAHDRFMIIDDIIYHIGASLKDLGKKMFGFSRMEEMTADELLSRM